MASEERNTLVAFDRAIRGIMDRTGMTERQVLRLPLDVLPLYLAYYGIDWQETDNG